MGLTLSVVGCGTMGRAILAGISVTSEHVVHASVRSAAAADSLKHAMPELHVSRDNVAVAAAGDLVVLGVKPQQAQEVLCAPGMAQALHDTVLVSLCAGITLAQLKEWAPGARCVRVMPNTPALVQQGMTVVSASSEATSDDLAQVRALFGSVGRVRVLDEKHLDAVTGLSGSGPAFVCVILEALADGGVMMGLPRDVATELAAQTMLGTAQMVLQTGQHPAALRDRVTTPAGCTIAGLFEMESGNVRSALARTVREAATVASGLGR